MAKSKEGNELSLEQKREWAELLYTVDSHTPTEIADKVKVSRQTVHSWIEKYGWKDLRDSYSMSRGVELKRIRGQVTELNDVITGRPKGERFATGSEADTLVKLTAAAKNMETEANLTEIINVSKDLLDWLRPVDLDKAKELSGYFDAHIKYKLSRLQ